MKFFFLSSHAHYALDPASSRVSGGAELQVALLAKELAHRGHQVVIAGGETGQRDNLMHVGVMTRNAGKFHTGGALDALMALPKVMSLLADCHPDYVVVLGWTSWLYLLAKLRPFFGFKLVFICSLDTEIDGSFGISHGIKGKLFERGVAQSDFRFAMTEHQRKLFGRLHLSCGFFRNLVLPRTQPLPSGKQVDLLWVGRCQNIKRPHLFLDIAERLPESRCEMICSKEDKVLWNEVEARAATLGNLIFHERVPYHEIQDHYDEARFLVSTSKAEGFPNVMIQAAQGRAGILSLELDPDGLIHTFNAGFCAGGDFELLVNKTRSLLANSQESEQMGIGAEEMLRDWLDNDKNTEAFLHGLP